MKKTYKVYLRHGVTLIIKGDDFILQWGQDGYTSWEIKNADRWAMFLPSDIVAVERIKWWKG